MFQWLKNLGGDENSLQPILNLFNVMLQDGHRMFDLASNALLGDVATDVIREDLFLTDRKINHAEQDLRRNLIVHASVHGRAEFPSCLVLMSVAKDAERIGDYCKNIYDLAASLTFSASNPQFADLKATRDRISVLLGKVQAAYSSQNEQEAKGVLKEAERLEDACDEQINNLVSSDDSQVSDIAAALSWRYFKRVAGHSKNVSTAIFMPIHKLDFFDER